MTFGTASPIRSFRRTEGVSLNGKVKAFLQKVALTVLGMT